ncbi:MAG: hypothetical protein NUW01_07170 [Gemmatimonadaceae bacterium]|nr:hypothetical protein [Gemmatimonadaceae bacterium]
MRDRFMQPNGRLTKEEIDAIPLDYEPRKLDKSDDRTRELFKKAKVYEIWSKADKKVIWLCKGYEKGPLDVKDDPLKLRGFFPFPKPLFATMTNGSLTPVPDFAQYQDQANEIDQLTQRISLLTKALRVLGLYPGEMNEIKRLLQDTQELELIPVPNWAMYAEKGGMDKCIGWFPVEKVAEVLTKLIENREVLKSDVYEITGMSDILRGVSDPEETATAQGIKAQWGSVRTKDRQKEVQRFVRDILRIKAEIIFNHFKPETILEITNAKGMGQSAQFIPQALALLQSPALRHFRVDIETDSTIQPDEAEEKAARVEFLTAVGNFLTAAAPLVTAQPMLAPMFGEMLMFGVRAFKAGDQVESAIEKAMQMVAQAAQQPQANPEADKAKADIELAREKAGAEIEIKREKNQADIELEREKMMGQQVLAQERTQGELAIKAAQPPPQVMQ